MHTKHGAKYAIKKEAHDGIRKHAKTTRLTVENQQQQYHC
jgi:hypothetical protein